MFKGLFFSCLHYTERPPIMRKEEYGTQILRKLIQVLLEGRDRGIDVFCLGDLFHRKSGTTIREISRILKVLKKFKPIKMILGNHDVQGYNQNLETQPIGVLEKAGAVEIIGDDEEIYNNGVWITGSNYKIGYEVPETFERSISDDEFHIHLTHGLLTNTSLPFECVQVKDLSLSCDMLINGHYHKYWDDKELGVYNIGSIARVAMEKNEINKKPIVLYVEVENGKAKVEKIKIKTEKDVWISEVKRDTLDSEEVMKFAKSIQEMEFENDEEMLNELLKDVDEDVRSKVFSYLGE